MSPSRCPPWQPERPGPTRREPRRAQRSYTTPRDTIFALIATAKLHGFDPQAWLSNGLTRIADQKIDRIDEQQPWCYPAKAA